ncbi:hypothetical protein [Oxalobacter paraformigenes]|uniref:hypothetical protein n=1 Tax=Oxalobacter paraformigenes TaxID=556268 RepID=UPI0002D4D94F|nr:hypothetical protein [Oxalobacter paraformigenes]
MKQCRDAQADVHLVPQKMKQNAEIAAHVLASSVTILSQQESHGKLQTPEKSL